MRTRRVHTTAAAVISKHTVFHVELALLELLNFHAEELRAFRGSKVQLAQNYEQQLCVV